LASFTRWQPIYSDPGILDQSLDARTRKLTQLIYQEFIQAFGFWLAEVQEHYAVIILVIVRVNQPAAP
jgi:hypothetical protein